MEENAINSNYYTINIIIIPWCKDHKTDLVGIAVDDGLLLEFELARVLSVALYAHGSIVVTIELPQNQIID